MKKRLITAASLLGAVLLVFASCSSTPKVQRVSTDTVVDLSGNWNDTDVRNVTNDLIKQALAAPRVSQFVEQFSAKHNGALPKVIVGVIKNKSSEPIDTTIISQMFRPAIINSGKLDFVENGSARDELRAERQDQQTSASEATAAPLGQENGAQLMLQGTVNSIVDTAGNKQVRSYFVTASLTNLATNVINWEGENDSIKKEISRPKSKM
jgi:uncharacterized protein (TIGR02722 family)